MSEFSNVTVVKAANSYFNGQVVSRTVKFDDGSKKTLGFMQSGDYEFATEAAEIMEVLGGAADVCILDGTNESWKNYAKGDEFHVPANSSFKLKVSEYMDYCCSYIP